MEFAALLLHFILKDQYIFRSRSYDSGHVVAGVLERAYDRIERRYADTAAYTKAVAEILDMRGLTQRTDKIIY